MAKKQTHTLEIHGKHHYALAKLERKLFPHLHIYLHYLGKEGKEHIFEGKVEILDAGDYFLSNLPARLKQLKEEELAIRATNKRSASKEAMDWADDTVGEFLMSGLFGLAMVDATGIDKGIYEYEPEVAVTKARVYKVG